MSGGFITASILDYSYTPKALGAKVIAAAGSPEKMDICKRYGGADFAIDYTSPNWQKEVLSITKGKGVDVIYDPVGRIRGMCVTGSYRH